MAHSKFDSLNGRSLLTLGAFAAAAAAISACGGSAAPVQPVNGGALGSPTPRATATASATASAKPTATAVATATPTPTASPTPSPSPPPTSGGSEAACILTLASTGSTYAFVPAFSSADTTSLPDSLAEVKIATGTTIASAFHRSFSQPVYRTFFRGGRSFVANVGPVSPLLSLSPAPSECGADATHRNLYIMSNGQIPDGIFYPPSPVINVVNVSTTGAMSQTGTFTTDATPFLAFTSQTLDIAGIVYDPTDSAVIISTAAGYELYAASSPFNKLGALAGKPAENFGYNPANNVIWSPWYDDSKGTQGIEYGTVNLASGGGTLYNMTGGPAVNTPDSASIDTTGIAFSPEEFATTWYLVNLNAAATSGSTFTAPSTTLVPTGLDSSVDKGSVAGLTDSAITGHLVWIAGEFSNGFGVPPLCALALPAAPTSGAPVPGDYACGLFPTMPNGAPFNTPGDPHAVAAFDLGTEHYGLIFDTTYSYVAIVDLGKLLAEPREAGFAHTVDPTRNLITDGVLYYVQI